MRPTPELETQRKRPNRLLEHADTAVGPTERKPNRLMIEVDTAIGPKSAGRGSACRRLRGRDLTTWRLGGAAPCGEL